MFASTGSISLLEMLDFSAHRYVAAGDMLQRTSGLLRLSEAFSHESLNPRHEDIKKQFEGHLEHSLSQMRTQLPRLYEECQELGLRASAAQAIRVMEEISKEETSKQETRERIAKNLLELTSRIHDELKAMRFFALEPLEQQFYSDPMRGWEKVTLRFSVAVDDIEEANKCYALGRYPACIFHLMRITEAAVLELGKFIDPSDHKPQFSSVLKKIDNLVQKTKWPDWPEAAKPHKQLYVDLLPRLYAVKDSWRDKVSHFDGHIIPTNSLTNRDRARDIYNSTLSLMVLLAERLTVAS